MAKKSAVERYLWMDEKSSEELWNHDFGSIIIQAFECAVRNGKMNKTVRQLIDDIEIEFNKGR